MSYRVKMMVRTILIALVVAAGVALITLSLHGCTTTSAPPGTMAGHNTTLPAQPACFFLCFADVHSSIENPAPQEPRDKKGKATAPAPATVAPSSVINTAPTVTTKPSLPMPAAPKSYP